MTITPFMPATILVVEHEPRYAERMKEAFATKPVEWQFAADGEQALQILSVTQPSLIILSSVIPKISTADLIRQIKSRSANAGIPILITVSGYVGRNPRADAMRLGADDIVPKPFPESVFVDKVEQLLKLHEGPKLTSDQIFGDIFTEEKPAAKTKSLKGPTANVDDLLEQTLTGMQIPPGLLKKTVSAPAPPQPTTPSKPRTTQVDRLVQDTLSGLEKQVRHKTPQKPTTSGATVETPMPPPAVEEKVLASSPIFQPAETVAVPAEPEEDPATGRFGQYMLVERIARGGMAEVWKARMTGVEGFQKIVAIKKILPHLSEDADFVNMFIDEAKLAAQLNHNNIIHIYDLGKIAHSYYIAMEYVDGHDLKDILKRAEERRHPVPVELALFIASKVAAALDYAHRKRDFEQKELGIVHRDVSPQNILISAEGDIKLCDFGIAKAATKASPHTQAGALKGKIQYMSPEQAWGKGIDRRSDIFALASVLFEMLTGRRLFAGDNEISILDQVREAQVEPPSSINDDVQSDIDAIVLKSLSREPDGRYQTAGEMARAVDALLYGFRPTPTNADLAIYLDRIYSEEPATIVMPLPQPEVVPPPVTPPVAPAPVIVEPAPPRPSVSEFAVSAVPPRRRKLWIPLAAAALLAGVAISGVLMVRRADESRPATRVLASPAESAAVQPAEGAPPPPVAPIQSSTAPAEEFEPVAIDTTLDQALIDQEVARRIEAERARLEQRRDQQMAAERAKQAARPELMLRSEPQPGTPPVVRIDPVVQQPDITAEPPPAESLQTQTTVPPQNVTETIAAAAPRPVREGDLVEIGTPGLIEPELINMRKVPYPPAAKLQKVSGTVFVRALVSENGRVLDATILRGVQRNVGLNEAAVEMVRGATFKPATKDGIRVRAYKTLTIPFKL